MPKDSIVEIPSGSGNKYRYEYSEGQTLYRGPVGSAPEIGEAEFMAAMKGTGAMSEVVFWALVDKLNWGKDLDYKRIERYLLREITKDEAEAMREQFKKQKSELYKALDPYVQLSDDSYDDLLSHIIGLGEDEYNSNMRNPRKASERADMMDFKESFSYAIPHTDDYRMTELNEWKPKIDEKQKSYKKARNEASVDIRDEYDTILHALDTLESGDVKGFLATKREAVGAATLITEREKEEARKRGEDTPFWAIVWTTDQINHFYGQIDHYLGP